MFGLAQCGCMCVRKSFMWMRFGLAGQIMKKCNTGMICVWKKVHITSHLLIETLIAKQRGELDRLTLLAKVCELRKE